MSERDERKAYTTWYACATFESLGADPYWSAFAAGAAWQRTTGALAERADWPAVLLLVNRYATHVIDAANHEAASRSDIAQAAALKALADLRHAWFSGQAPAAAVPPAPQPIKTAPTGSVLLWSARDKAWRLEVFYPGLLKHAARFTHWAPQPPAPEESGEQR